MAVVNVAITDTFDVWRVRTNQIAVQSNSFENSIIDLNLRINNSPSYAYANNIGVQANAYANLVGQGANNYMITIQNGSNVAVGQGANAYANLVGQGANNYLLSVIAGANTAVGNGANNFFKATMNGANADARIANNLTSGVVPFARLSGSYTSIIGVGTIDTGTWNATNISLNKGGTNASLTASAGAVAYSTASALALSGVGASGSVLTSAGTSAPTWTVQSSLQVGYATVAGSAGSATTAGTVTTAAQPSITSVGTLTSLAVSGEITAGGDITAFSSDARLKGDIQTITDALSKVQLITGITYKHNDLAKSFGYTDESRFAGVLAQ
jgi:hypothetical protein